MIPEYRIPFLERQKTYQVHNHHLHEKGSSLHLVASGVNVVLIPPSIWFGNHNLFQIFMMMGE